MASAEDEYTLIRNDHSSNLTINLKDLLEQKELIDVTLVTGRHMFRAHRLVLSAISTYFRQMFVQVPANQQAFGKFFVFWIFEDIQTRSTFLEFRLF